MGDRLVAAVWNLEACSRHLLHRAADTCSPLRFPNRFSTTEKRGVAVAPLLSLRRMPIFKMVTVYIPGGLMHQTLLTVRQP